MAKQSPASLHHFSLAPVAANHQLDDGHLFELGDATLVGIDQIVVGRRDGGDFALCGRR